MIYCDLIIQTNAKGLYRVDYPLVLVFYRVDLVNLHVYIINLLWYILTISI